MKQHYNTKSNAGQRRPAQVGPTPPLNDHIAKGWRQANPKDGQNHIGESGPGLVVAIREWIQENLERMRDFLSRLSLSNLQPGRTRWGPPWQWKRIEDEGPPGVGPPDGEKDSAARQPATTAYSAGTKSVNRRKGTTQSVCKTVKRIGMPKVRSQAMRLRSPRSETTRALCLLNRLRAHAHSDDATEAINERHGDGALRSQDRDEYGSSGLRIQRWVSALPMGMVIGSGKRGEYLSPSLSPLKERG